MNEFLSLIHLAKDSISSYFSEKPVNFEPYEDYDDNLGVFVTLKLNGELRGCIGYVTASQPLYKSVFELAREAAFSDPRFEPLSKEESSKIEVEISVLTKPEKMAVKRPADLLSMVNIGKDGLIIENSNKSGLLLPQVFVEHECDAMAALELLCQKAGLHKNAWKEEESRIFKFQARIVK